MSNAAPCCESCKSFETVMPRVAAEIGGAARDLAGVESRVSDILQRISVRSGDLAQLQALDRIGQQLRTLEVFLRNAIACRCGRIDMARALDEVWLEDVRARLRGETAPVSAGGEVEVW